MEEKKMRYKEEKHSYMPSSNYLTCFSWCQPQMPASASSVVDMLCLPVAGSGTQSYRESCTSLPPSPLWHTKIRERSYVHIKVVSLAA